MLESFGATPFSDLARAFPFGGKKPSSRLHGNHE
jgi:hypothetical protein